MASPAEVTLSLREKRMNIVRQQQTFVDSLTGKEWSQEDHDTYNRMEAEYQALNAEIIRRDELETRANEAAALREASDRAGVTNPVEPRTAALDFYSWMRSRDGGGHAWEANMRAAAKEMALLRQGAGAEEIRALAWDAGSGSLVVPTEMARTLYQAMEASIAGFRIGASVLNTATGGNIQLPKLKTHGVGTQVATQNLTIGGTDPIHARIDLTSYKYGQLVQISNELLRDGVYDVESFIASDLGYALGRVINADLVVGSGTGEPSGMFTPIGTGTNTPIVTGGSLIPPTVEKWIDTQYSINDDYRSRASWLMKDATAGTIRKLRDGAGGTVGAFLWEPSLTEGLRTGTPGQFLGSPLYTDPNCTAGTNVQIAAYGDFSEYVIRTVGNVQIDRDDSVGFASDSVYFRAKWEVDGDHRDVTAVNILSQTP